MKFAGELIVKAPREQVFDRLKDAHFFASCVEGVRDLKELTPTTYSANFETKIAYIKFKFEVAVELTRADRPDAIEAKIEGKPHGIVGRLSAISSANCRSIAFAFDFRIGWPRLPSLPVSAASTP